LREILGIPTEEVELQELFLAASFLVHIIYTIVRTYSENFIRTA